MPLERPHMRPRQDAVELEAERRAEHRDRAPEREARGGGGGITEKYFELQDDHAPGDTTPAYPRTWDRDGDEYVTDTDADTVDVVDVLKRFRGRGRDEEAPAEEDSGGTRGKHGSFLRAVKRHGQWEIDDMQPHAMWFKADVDESGDFTAPTDPAVDGVTVILPVDTALLMADVTQFSNTFLWDGDDDAVIVGNWNDEDDSTTDPDTNQMDCAAEA